MSKNKKAIIVLSVTVLLIIGCLCGAFVFSGKSHEANREVLSQAYENLLEVKRFEGERESNICYESEDGIKAEENVLCQNDQFLE